MRQLALQQAKELEAVSGGAIEVVAWREASDSQRFMIDISLSTHGIETVGAGIRLRSRERFLLWIPENYPFEPPAVWTRRRRWPGTSHVQWGRYLCLYAAPAIEWNPADGMRGLIDRLNTWLVRAAQGTLDPDGQPLHPPIIYDSSEAGQLIVHPDVGERVPWGDTVTPGETQVVFGWCQLAAKRVDVREWLTFTEMADRILAPDFTPLDDTGNPFIVAPLILVSNELSMEYPDKAADLAASLSEFGYPREELLRTITLACTANRVIADQAGVEETTPAVVMIGTPSRRTVGTRRLAHIAAWKFDEMGAEIVDLLRRVQRLDNDQLAQDVKAFASKWINTAGIDWMKVRENRPEVTNRRDASTAATWLSGKKVLVLGCGALGAPIAEHCVRAGVSALTVSDDGAVNPGILVRQPYRDQDIGHSKARRLAGRLSGIRPDLTVNAHARNAIGLFTGDKLTPPDYDLIIDATANIGVRAAIEAMRTKTDRDQWPPVITGLFGHDATRALAMLSRPGATGGAHDILRRIAIDARARGGLAAEIANDFFPNPPRTDMFFPEPGCSAPTFIGSGIQTAALASTLFHAALTELAEPSTGDPMVAVGIKLPEPDGTQSAAHWWRWPNDHVTTDASQRYEVRISAQALAEMRAETRRGARTRGPNIETGGMLLGSFDDAVGCIYIDTAAGPSPDSALSHLYFSHGTHGTQQLVEHHLHRTVNRVGFAGMWHTHPYGLPRPSATDEAGMGWIVSPSGAARRAVMLILAGAQPVWDAWRERGDIPHLYLRVVERDDPVNQTAGQRTHACDTGRGYPGGYYQPVKPAAPPWWRRALGLDS